MPAEPINELTFVARLGVRTALRAARRKDAGLPVVIARGDVEERQIDPATGRYKRCDIRLSSPSNRKLISGEMKRPEVAEGRDPRNESLVQDARRKAVARGLPYYFTCNMAEVVLFSVGLRPEDPDREEKSYRLANLSHSNQVEAHWPQIETAWDTFLDDLERRLEAVVRARPPATTGALLILREAIYTAAEEAIDRVLARVAADLTLAERAKEEAASTFGFAVALDPRYADVFRDELLQILRLGIFVVAQKLILYRVLAESGPRRELPFELDPLDVPRHSSDPTAIRLVLEGAIAHAISRSNDYETAFLPTPHDELVFLSPHGVEEIQACHSGEVWGGLLDAVNSASWTAINQNLVGFLYEVIVEPAYRHQLGQHYTREDVVDLLVTYAVRSPGDIVLDPASGGGSFVRRAYTRKRELGESHESALGTTWAIEITAFAAELTTITLATADPHEPAAYPRVLLRDFFDLRPGLRTDLEVPGMSGKLLIPTEFDAIVGNPPYISYRHQTNQAQVLNALAAAPRDIHLPKFSGKSDEYVWFIAHATSFLKPGGRLAFVVSSSVLFADYGIPLIRFLARHYRIEAVIDSIVERWFIDADTNTVLLFLQRETDPNARWSNEIRFIRFRRPLAQVIPSPEDDHRRGVLEDLVDELLHSPAGGEDPRFTISTTPQGDDGGLESLRSNSGAESNATLEATEDDE
ncbi:HsdM family class I SAM-dependent methyltransferase [Mycobacterium colombiense]